MSTTVLNIIVFVQIGLAVMASPMELSAQNLDLSQGLIAWWPFDGNVEDASGNDQHGQLHGDAKVVAKGRVGSALYLDGEGDYLTAGKGINLRDDFTVAVWIRAEDIDRKYPNILSKYETNTEGPYDFALDYDKVKLGLSENGTYRSYYSNSTVPQDRWVHLAWVGNDQNFRIYINGEIDARHRIAPMTQNEDKVCIGRQAFMFETNGDLEFKGFLDELRVYDRSLNEEEIRQLFKHESPHSKEWVLSGILRDQNTGKGIKGEIILEDANSGEEIFRTKTKSNGFYSISLRGVSEVSLNAKADGYMPGSSFIEMSSATGSQIDISVQALKVGAEVRMESIYFVGGTATLLPSSGSTLDRLVEFMQNNPTVEIEISGHTDDASDDEDWKIRLSGARAKSVANYLIRKGIEDARIATNAWGDQKPVSREGTSKSRKLNRRVEFRITKV